MSADPWTVVATAQMPAVRSYKTYRGIIHSHSPYSHDACDGHPYDNGVRNEACFEDCRRGMCHTLQDFVFLTDHDDLFADHEYPQVLLYKQGDQLIERAGKAVANRIACSTGHSVILAAGTESAMMPIGLEHHVGDTPEQRNRAYNEVSSTAVEALQEAGALVFLQHTEGWPLETILDLPINGIELYNLHQNLEDRMGDVVTAVLELVLYPDELPVPELVLITVFEESQADLWRWSKAVEQRQMPAVLATDVHQNVFNDATHDGERLDSFRRMMHLFANYVRLPQDSPLDDKTVKQAIADGRLYGAFDFLGYAMGFDFYGQSQLATYEMGQKIDGHGLITLHVTMPTVFGLDPNGPMPELFARILRAEDGDWTVVAQSNQDLSFAAEAGVYRAEIRIIPHHLKPWLGNQADQYIKDYVWVYSNPIYIDMPYGSE